MAPALPLDPAALDADDGLPLFVQIAQAIVAEVRRGRLLPGDRLTGSRTLARLCGVHRNTVLAAYAELAAEGWITTCAARGTFVSAALPDPKPRRFARAAPAQRPAAEAPGYDLLPAPEPYRASLAHPRGTLVLAGGVPDVRLLPTAELARAYRRALRSGGSTLLAYGDARGHERLRVAIAALLSNTRGLSVDAGSVLITRGSQMALYLTARALIAPGEVVAVESPGYPPAWEAFRLAGARIVPLPVDRAGVRVDALAALSDRVRAVYLTPHHQYPTTVTLAAARRLELLDLAQRRRIAVVEDDFDHEFHFDGRPVLPLASADAGGNVVYVGTLSKVLAPGLRIGFVAAPRALCDRLAALRSYLDIQGDHAVEAAVAELLEDGELQRHVRRARRIYQARRDVLCAALLRRLGDAVSFETPSGGMALWLRARRGLDVAAWERAALARGVAFQAGGRFTFDRRAMPWARVGFARLDQAELEEAARRLARALGDLAIPTRGLKLAAIRRGSA